jgi:DNA-binding HxlR family transcriptional regulator
MAKALDVVGDRWSLLIVRELMLLGPSRYTDIQNGLPGIASNLLADRLRRLEEAGVVKRELAPPPIATTLFSLTQRGDDLREVVRELGRWGAPLLGAASDDEEFRSYWMALPLELYYSDTKPDGPPVRIELRMGDQPPVVVETFEGTVRAVRGSVENPEVALIGPPRLVITTLSGRVPLDEARRQGLQLEGDPKILARIRSTLVPEHRSQLSDSRRSTRLR